MTLEIEEITDSTTEEVSLGFMAVSGDTGFLVQEYSDGTVSLTAVDATSVAATVGLGGDDKNKEDEGTGGTSTGSSVVAVSDETASSLTDSIEKSGKLDFAAGFAVESGDTWTFDSMEEAEELRTRIEQHQEARKHLLDEDLGASSGEGTAGLVTSGVTDGEGTGTSTLDDEVDAGSYNPLDPDASTFTHPIPEADTSYRQYTLEAGLEAAFGAELGLSSDAEAGGDGTTGASGTSGTSAGGSSSGTGDTASDGDHAAATTTAHPTGEASSAAQAEDSAGSTAEGSDGSTGDRTGTGTPSTSTSSSDPSEDASSGTDGIDDPVVVSFGIEASAEGEASTEQTVGTETDNRTGARTWTFEAQDTASGEATASGGADVEVGGTSMPEEVGVPHEYTAAEGAGHYVDDWIARNNASHGTPLALTEAMVDPSAPSDDPFEDLLYEQAEMSSVDYTVDEQDTAEFAKEIGEGLKLGYSQTQTHGERTADEATYLGAPDADGVRRSVDYPECEQ